MSISNIKYPLLLDGGMGRALEQQGVTLKGPLWSANALVDSTDIIKQVHQAFIQAGADVITSNTYALTEYLLTQAGKQDLQRDWMRIAYQCAHQAIKETAASVALDPKRPAVRLAASIPPLTETYRPDLVDTSRLDREYDLHVSEAAEHKADILLAETLSTLEEAGAVCRCAKNYRIPLWVSFTVNAQGDLRGGALLEEAIELCLSQGASAVLVNCSKVDEVTQSILKFERYSRSASFVYGAYANRFTDINDKFSLINGLNTLDDHMRIESYCQVVSGWLEHGADIVGGCCGIGVEYIAAIAAMLRKDE